MPPRTTSEVLTAIQRLIASTAAGNVGILMLSAGRPKKMKKISRSNGTARTSSTTQATTVSSHVHGTKRSSPRTTPAAESKATTAATLETVLTMPRNRHGDVSTTTVRFTAAAAATLTPGARDRRT